MKNKHWLLFMIGIILIGAFIGYKVYENSKSLVGLVKVNNLVYVVTYEPVKSNLVQDELGKVKKKISNTQVPNTNFESNELTKGTKLYTYKKGDNFPRAIVFKENGKFYLASEAIDRDN